MGTKSNLYSSGIKLMKLVHTPLKVSFLKALVTNLLFSRNILTLRKESDLLISVSIENFMFLCSLLIYSRKNCECSSLLNKKLFEKSKKIRQWSIIYIKFYPRGLQLRIMYGFSKIHKPLIKTFQNYVLYFQVLIQLPMVGLSFLSLYLNVLLWMGTHTAQKMKFSIKDFFRKCDQYYLLKESLMENFTSCVVTLKDSFECA